jgi:Zn-dependent protease/CBS domain-containing protein
MFSRSLQLFRPFGIQIEVHWSWLILAVLIASSLATGWFPVMVPDSTTGAYWIAGTLCAMGLFLSILIHEFCHAVVGRSFQMKIDRITLFLFGGVAHLDDEPPSPKAEFWMAIAGPIASVVLAFSFFGLYVLATGQAWPPLLQAALSYLASINIVVAIFNMLPGFPLDGGRVLRAAIWQFKGNIVTATRVASGFGQFFGILLLMLGFFVLFAGGGVSGIWSILLGFLLITFARSAYVQVAVRQSLHGKSIERFMNRAPATVTPETPVSELMRDMINHGDQSLYPVVESSGELLGCVDPSDISSIPENEWPYHQVAEITRTCAPDRRIEPEQDAEKALMQMSRQGHRELIVVRDNRLIGLLTQSALMKYLTLREA